LALNISCAGLNSRRAELMEALVREYFAHNK
jgi:hypothetical protein